MKTKVNVINEHPDKAGGRRCGVLDIDTQIVKLSNTVEKPLRYYEDNDPCGVKFFETKDKGKTVQKSGKYEKSNI